MERDKEIKIAKEAGGGGGGRDYFLLQLTDQITSDQRHQPLLYFNCFLPSFSYYTYPLVTCSFKNLSLSLSRGLLFLPLKSRFRRLGLPLLKLKSHYSIQFLFLFKIFLNRCCCRLKSVLDFIFLRGDKNGDWMTTAQFFSVFFPAGKFSLLHFFILVS